MPQLALDRLHTRTRSGREGGGVEGGQARHWRRIAPARARTRQRGLTYALGGRGASLRVGRAAGAEAERQARLRYRRQSRRAHGSRRCRGRISLGRLRRSHCRTWPARTPRHHPRRPCPAWAHACVHRHQRGGVSRGPVSPRADLHDLPAEAEKLAIQPVGLLAEGLHQSPARVAERCNACRAVRQCQGSGARGQLGARDRAHCRAQVRGGWGAHAQRHLPPRAAPRSQP